MYTLRWVRKHRWCAKYSISPLKSSRWQSLISPLAYRTSHSPNVWRHPRHDESATANLSPKNDKSFTLMPSQIYDSIWNWIHHKHSQTKLSVSQVSMDFSYHTFNHKLLMNVSVSDNSCVYITQHQTDVWSSTQFSCDLYHNNFKNIKDAFVSIQMIISIFIKTKHCLPRQTVNHRGLI